MFAKHAVSVDNAVVGAPEAGYGNVKIYVEVDDGITVDDLNAADSPYVLYTFQHTEAGETIIGTSKPVFAEDENGIYMAFNYMANNGFVSMDVYVTNGLIDFASSDWGIIDIYTDIQL